MAQNKTVVTEARPAAYLAAIAEPQRRRDCEALARMMAKVSGHDARMWGPSIVGFGTHRYPLSGGKVGEICALGFSSRKGDISIYGVAGEGTDAARLGRLRKHKPGKGCLYLARLADVDLAVLEQLMSETCASAGSTACASASTSTRRRLR